MKQYVLTTITAILLTVGATGMAKNSDAAVSTERKNSFIHTTEVNASLAYDRVAEAITTGGQRKLKDALTFIDLQMNFEQSQLWNAVRGFYNYESSGLPYEVSVTIDNYVDSGKVDMSMYPDVNEAFIKQILKDVWAQRYEPAIMNLSQLITN